MSDLKDIREELSENTNIENQEEQQYENINLEDLVSQLEHVIEPIQLPIENLTGIEFDKNSFSKGLKDVSYTCGMLTGLINVGLTAKDALDYVLNKENTEHNKVLQKMINDNNVEISKIQQIKTEQQIL